jgi:DNA-binding transcriptional LysR family regulator
MELRQLRYFVAVADTGAFSRAAVRLRITQPALWRQVHALEAELGVRLFGRVGRGVRLTSDGDAFLRRSRELLAGVEQLGADARAVRAGDAGCLRVGASPQVIQSVLAPFLARYLKSRPGIEFHLVEEGAARLPSLVERGEVDVALAVLLRGGERLERRLLMPLRILAAQSPTRRLAGRATLDVRDLHLEPVLLLRHGFGTRELFDAACRVAHARPHVVLESGDPQSLVALAEAGRGVAVVPSTMRFTGRKVRLAPILHAGASVGVWGWVVWDPARPLPACAGGFVDALVEHARRTCPGREFDRRAPPVPRPTE